MIALDLVALDLNQFAQMSATRLMDCLIEGTGIAIIAGLGLALARRQNAGVKFAAWFSVLVAIASLPLIGNVWSREAITPGSAAAHPAISLPSSWAIYLFAAWALIAAWFLVGVGRGLWHLQVLRKSGVRVDPALLDPMLQETLGRSTRAVALYTSDQVRVPTAIGLFEPAIVLPGWLLNELPTGEINQLLVHELAHLRRYDDWTNLAQKLVKALFFFHPAVWWIEKKLSLEREMACDDAVLAETANPRAYAECLAHLAEKTFLQRSILQRTVALAQAAIGRLRQTSVRVAQILDANRVPAKPISKPAMGLVTVLAIACAAGISRAPRLVAFNDPAARTTDAAIADANAAGRAASPVAYIRPVKAVFEPHSVEALKTAGPMKKNSAYVLANHRNANGPQRQVMAEAAVAKAHAPTAVEMIRLTEFEMSPVAFTETVFVITRETPSNDAQSQNFQGQNIQSSAPADDTQPVMTPAYSIRVWHVLVLHTTVNPDSVRIPAKQT